ncbi:MAG: tRNA (adenosine(37)-N6)-threonylcarbamoyltransferase complex ATPase subunit type 1 TsaE [Spirochaetes bacterium]|nr:tRNA (adenosine(37)-N6)-threonylcarbamoyltransferase complex ATPase subunit type 1 TsaE [Spirochaetota bacterium]
MKKEIITRSEQETFNWAFDLGASAEQGSVFALSGDLGTGKTIIAKGIAKGLGIDDEITSPTFLMMEIYEGRFQLYHFDLYRIDNLEELDELNFEEYWFGDGVSVIEWAEKAGSRIPDNITKIALEWAGDTERRIRIEYPGN